MDRKPIKTAVRQRRREERLPEGMRACILCGHRDLENLIPVTTEWLKAHSAPHRLLEDHHLVGKKRDPQLTVPLCRNCHGNATERLAAAHIPMQAEHDPRFRVAMILDALAVFFEMLVSALRRYAESLRSDPPSTAANA